jgi:hypothetical protein
MGDRIHVRAGVPAMGDRMHVRAGAPAMGDRMHVRAGAPAMGDRIHVRAGAPAMGDRMLVRAGAPAMGDRMYGDLLFCLCQHGFDQPPLACNEVGRSLHWCVGFGLAEFRVGDRVHGECNEGGRSLHWCVRFGPVLVRDASVCIEGDASSVPGSPQRAWVSVACPDPHSVPGCQQRARKYKRGIIRGARSCSDSSTRAHLAMARVQCADVSRKLPRTPISSNASCSLRCNACVCVCVRVRACVRACVHACVHACVCVCVTGRDGKRQSARIG